MNDYLFEETEIKLPDSFIQALSGQTTNIETMLTTLIRSHEHEVKMLLSGYHYDSKGSVGQVQLKTGSLECMPDFGGTFLVGYGVNYHMGCSDISYDELQQMKISFRLDVKNHVINLAGERIPLRVPDEL